MTPFIKQAQQHTRAVSLFHPPRGLSYRAGDLTPQVPVPATSLMATITRIKQKLCIVIKGVALHGSFLNWFKKKKNYFLFLTKTGQVQCFHIFNVLQAEEGLGH